RTEYLPVEAEALYRLGALQMRTGDHKTAEMTLLDAISAAEASQHDEIAARAWIDLMFFSGFYDAHYDEALRWNRYAAEAMKRVSGAELLEANRWNALGRIQWQQHHLDDAVRSLNQSLATCKREFGPEHPCVAWALDVIALVRSQQGRL